MKKLLRIHPPLIERFQRKYIPEPNSGCWLWTASGSHNGYGVFWNEERQVYAHRWSYEYHIGPIPDGLQLDHLCRVTWCVNPDHLEPVTGLENMRRGTHAQKTHCLRGHPFSGQNLYVPKPRRRGCRECRKLAQREYVKRKEARS